MMTLGMARLMRQRRITDCVRHALIMLADYGNLQQGELSATNADILHTLAAGKGISRYDEIGLLEECGNCGLWFASSALRTHIPVCVRDYHVRSPKAAPSCNL